MLARIATISAALAISVAAGSTTDPWYTIDSGGQIQMSGGGIVVNATIGQPDIGVAAIPTITVSGGFWSGVSAQAPDAGDCDGNGAIELSDFSVIAHCLTGPEGISLFSPSECHCMDIDGDSDVDLEDVTGFLLIFSPNH